MIKANSRLARMQALRRVINRNITDPHFFKTPSRMLLYSHEKT